MTFLHPEYLWGLLTVLIPLIIHLFNFQRPRVVYFTNVKFLREVKTASTSRNRLRHWLILLSRMLFLAALTLAFARPVIPGQGAEKGGDGQGRVSIYLDNSYSLQNEQDGQRLLDKGKQVLDQLVELFPATTRFQLVTNTPGGNFRYFYQGETLREKVLETDFVTLASPLAETYRRQLRALAEQGSGAHQIFWLSDFQRSTLGDLQRLETDSSFQHYIVPLRGESVANLLVDSVWLENPFLQVNENNILHVRLRNTGDEPLENRLVQFFIDQKQVASQPVSMGGNTRKTIQLSFAVTSPGEQTARIEVEDYPITFDNKHYFTLNVAPKIRTLTIGGDAEARYASRVFSNEPFFVHQYFGIENVDYNAISEADVIVLAHLPTLDAAMQAALTDFLAAGGTLVIFPPDMPTGLQAYQDLLGTNVTRASEKTAIPLLRPKEGDPFYEGVFERIPSNMNVPQTRPVLQWSGKPILSYRDGRSFLSRQRRGKGTLFLFAASLSTENGNFQKHALFVPTMYRIALQSKRSIRPLSYSTERANITLLLDSLRSNQIFQLEARTQAGQPMIPGQRVLGNQLILELDPEGLEAGHYALVRQQDRRELALVAFNIPSAESELATYSDENLSDWAKPHVQIYDGSQVMDVIRSFRDQYVATPLWRYFVWLALLFLLVEVLLLRFWK